MSANKTKWVRLGDYIEEIDERNSDLAITLSQGIANTKVFQEPKQVSINSKADKIVRTGYFAYNRATTRNGEKISIAYRVGPDCTVSSAYCVFRVKDENIINPYFLWLYFSRSEFDRYARYASKGSAHEFFGWDEMCRVQIPLPSISIQRELVNTYNGLKSFAEDNEALIAPLTQACEALVVDCKRKYDEVALGEYIESCDERNSEGKYKIDDVRGISIEKKLIYTKANMEGVSLIPYKIIKPSEFAYVTVTSRNGNRISLAINDSIETFIVSSSYEVFSCKEHLQPQYLYMLLSRTEFDRYSRFNSWGSAREIFDWDELCRVRIPLPPPDVQQSIVNLYHCIEEAKRIAAEAREQMRRLCPALIQKTIHS